MDPAQIDPSQTALPHRFLEFQKPSRFFGEGDSEGRHPDAGYRRKSRRSAAQGNDRFGGMKDWSPILPVPDT